MFAPGTRVADRYTVLRALGTGGMGGVYEIRGDALSNRLAMKVIRQEYADNSQIRRRFEREARIQASLDHPSIGRVFDLVDHEGMQAIIMEFVDAPTLRQVLNQGRPTPARAREILLEIVTALDVAHDAGVVHRDVKPENVFVIPSKGDGVRCKLIDFGIARDLNADEAGPDATRLTRGQSFLGTYAYASPEQITMSSAVDQRSDLYSVGVVLWEMLAGVSPYAHLDSGYSVQVAVVSEPLPALPSDVPLDLAAFVAELTRKAPEERPQTAHELLLRLNTRPAPLDASTAIANEPPHHARVAATVVEARAAPRAAAGEQAARRPSAPPDRRKLGSRLMARALDEILAQLAVITCVGVVVYPVIVGMRGMYGGQSTGQKMLSLRTYDVRTGEPASPAQMLGRNVLDFFMLQLPLLGVTWPPSWAAFPLPILAGFWLGCMFGVELLVASANPDGRRIVDLLIGTRVAATS